MKRGLGFGVLFIVFLNMYLASAVTIFFDGFEDGNLNEWNLYSAGGANNWTASSTDPFNGLWHAQSQPQSTSEPASVMEINASTFGYSSLNFSYYRRLIALDAADEFQAEWFNGTAWIILEQTGSNSVNDASYVLKSYNLPANVGNNPNFKIRFECTAGAISEFCRVDDVRIIGA